MAMALMVQIIPNKIGKYTNKNPQMVSLNLIQISVAYWVQIQSN